MDFPQTGSSGSLFVSVHTWSSASMCTWWLFYFNLHRAFREHVYPVVDLFTLRYDHLKMLFSLSYVHWVLSYLSAYWSVPISAVSKHVCLSVCLYEHCMCPTCLFFFGYVFTNTVSWTCVSPCCFVFSNIVFWTLRMLRLCFWHKPTELAHSFLFCSCVCFCLYGPLNCFSFHKFSWQLSVFSLCSSGLISALLVLSSVYLFMKVSLSPDIILCNWLDLKHQLM